MSTRDLIDYAANDNAVDFRQAMYAAIHDRVSAAIDAKKQEISQNLITQSEEVEQIDELSKKTLSTYIKKAADTATDAAFQGGQALARNDLTASGRKSKEEMKKINGINKAANRLSGTAFDRKTQTIRNYKAEEVEQVSDMFLESYSGMSDAAKELVLHADNDHQLQYSSHEPIMNHLRRKAKAGAYNPEKAKDLWNYHADRAAQSYHKQHGTTSQPWNKMFTPSDRKQAAAHWEEMHRDSVSER